MKSYVLSVFDHAEHAQRYFDTMRVMGHDFIPISLMFGEPKDVTVPEYGLLIKTGKPYPGNTGRHYEIAKVFPTIAKDNNIQRNDWIFFTDVHDTIFQAPLPELPDNADILVCSEGKTIGQIEYWRERYPHQMYDWECFNAGSFAMRYHVYLEFLHYVNREWSKFLAWYRGEMTPRFAGIDSFPFESPMLHKQFREEIAKFFNAYSDTLMYNNFLRSTSYRRFEVPGLFTTYAYNYELGNVYQRDGVTYTKQGQVVSIVHFNGATKEYLEPKEEE